MDPQTAFEEFQTLARQADEALAVAEAVAEERRRATPGSPEHDALDSQLRIVAARIRPRYDAAIAAKDKFMCACAAAGGVQ